MIRRPTTTVLLLVALTEAACARATSPDAGKPAPSEGHATPPSGTLALGERITSPLVPLASIARDPERYRGHVFATTGTVKAVCRERGCWMEIADETGQAHVRMHGHTFFVPKTSSGHVARVQATLVPAQGGADDCEESASGAAGVAKVELDATGVELD